MPPPAQPHCADEEYVLLTSEALLAGTLALMTGCAQGGADAGMRELMAGKVVSNLSRLSEHPDLSAPMQRMLGQLITRWVQPVPREAAATWLAAPQSLQ